MQSESLYSRYRGKYVESKTKTASGKRKSLDKGDKLAQLLRGKSVEDLMRIAADNGVLAERWSHLNPGRFRMQVGHALRNLIRKSIAVIIDGESMKSL